MEKLSWASTFNASCKISTIGLAMICEEEAPFAYLYRKVSSVNIITQEKVSGRCGVSSNLKQFNKIIELSMYVTTN